MGYEAPSGAIYRLLVTFEGHETVPDVFRFDRFEQAQGWVAFAVRRHAVRGRVRAVSLQRGTPLSARRSEAAEDYTWTIEKRWGPEVVARILAQRAAVRPSLDTSRAERAPATGGDPRAGRSTGRRWSAGAAVSPVARWRPGGHGPRLQVAASAGAASVGSAGVSNWYFAAAGSGRLHKDTRWHFIGTFALVALAILTTLLYQTGGNPRLLLAATKPPIEPIKLELPFDARAGFVTIEPDAGRMKVRPPLRPLGFEHDRPLVP